MQAQDEASEEPDEAIAAHLHAGGSLHPANALARVEDRHEGRNDDQRSQRDRNHRHARADLDVRVQVTRFLVDLEPPDEVIDPQRDERPDQPHQENVPGFPHSSSHRCTPCVLSIRLWIPMLAQRQPRWAPVAWSSSETREARSMTGPHAYWVLLRISPGSEFPSAPQRST